MGQQFKPFLMQMQGTIQNPPPGMFQWYSAPDFWKLFCRFFIFKPKQTQVSWVAETKIYLKLFKCNLSWKTLFAIYTMIQIKFN